MVGKRCESNSDCPTTVEKRCMREVVYTFTTTYYCEDAGSPTSHCVGKTKSSPLEQCSEYQHCSNGMCVNTYLNECDYKCSDGGYGLYYCSDNCSLSDVMLSVSGDCSATGRYCCCQND